MKKIKVYIAGKVSGEPVAECTMKFGTAQKEIEALGYEAVNPLEVVGSFDVSWEVAMRICIKALMDCDAILLLPDVAHSKGANLEIDLVLNLKMPYYHSVKELDLDCLELKLAN